MSSLPTVGELLEREVPPDLTLFETRKFIITLEWWKFLEQKVAPVKIRLVFHLGDTIANDQMTIGEFRNHPLHSIAVAADEGNGGVRRILAPV